MRCSKNKACYSLFSTFQPASDTQHFPREHWLRHFENIVVKKKISCANWTQDTINFKKNFETNCSVPFPSLNKDIYHHYMQARPCTREHWRSHFEKDVAEEFLPYDTAIQRFFQINKNLGFIWSYWENKIVKPILASPNANKRISFKKKTNQSVSLESAVVTS